MVSQKWSKLVFHSSGVCFDFSDGVHGLRIFELWRNVLKYSRIIGIPLTE